MSAADGSDSVEALDAERSLFQRQQVKEGPPKQSTDDLKTHLFQSFLFKNQDLPNSAWRPRSRTVASLGPAEKQGLA